IELDKWEDNPIEGVKTQRIIPSTEKKLKTEISEFKEYLLNSTSDSKLDDYNEQMISVILNERLRGKKLAGSIYEDESNVNTLVEIDEIAETMLNRFLPPVELLQRIPGIMPE